MGNESGGGVAAKPKTFQPEICSNADCNKSFIPTNSRRKTCFECSPTGSAATSVPAAKRDSNVLSPLLRENGRPRRSSVSDPLSYDIDLLDNMSRDELIVECKAILASCNRDFSKFKEEFWNLKTDIEYQAQVCIDLKIIAADKDLEILSLKKIA